MVNQIVITVTISFCVATNANGIAKDIGRKPANAEVSASASRPDRVNKWVRVLSHFLSQLSIKD